DLIRWETVPYPSPADLGYTAFYPFMFIGLVLLVRERIGRLPAVEVIIDSLIVVTAFALIAYEVVLMPLTGAGSLSTTELVITLAWEVSAFSLVLLAGVALFVRSDELTRGPLSILMLGFVAFAVADVIYGALALDDAYSGGGLIDLGWQQGFVLIAVAALIAVRSSGQAARPIDLAGERRSSIARVVLIVASVLIVTAMAAYAASQPRVDRPIVVLVVLAGILLAVRLGYAAMQAERLIRRTSERDRLAGVVAASSAVSATLDLETLLPILASAAADAVGRKKAEVYVFTEELTEVELSALAGFTATETALFQSLIEAPIGAFPAEARILQTHKPTAQWIDEPGIPTAELVAFQKTGKLYTLVAPLIAHGRVLGVFDMWTPHDTTPFDAEDVAAAAAVGQQAGLAIHNARLLARMQRQAAEKEALLRVSQAAASSLELNAVLAQIAEASLGIASAEACSVEIWEPEHDRTILAAEATIADWPGTAP
ncbi:MAG: GAF domain-containing protein, partial [Vicinamibacterales bacterium]